MRVRGAVLVQRVQRARQPPERDPALQVRVAGVFGPLEHLVRAGTGEVAGVQPQEEAGQVPFSCFQC